MYVRHTHSSATNAVLFSPYPHALRCSLAYVVRPQQMIGRTLLQILLPQPTSAMQITGYHAIPLHPQSPQRDQILDQPLPLHVNSGRVVPCLKHRPTKLEPANHPQQTVLHVAETLNLTKHHPLLEEDPQPPKPHHHPLKKTSQVLHFMLL